MERRSATGAKIEQPPGSTAAALTAVPNRKAPEGNLKAAEDTTGVTVCEGNLSPVRKASFTNCCKNPLACFNSYLSRPSYRVRH